MTGVRWYLIAVLSCVSLVINDVEHFFMCYWLSVCLLLRNIYLGLLPIFALVAFLLLNFMSYLYILEIRPLSVASFAKIFLPFCELSLHFKKQFRGKIKKSKDKKKISFAVQNLFGLIRSWIFFFGLFMAVPRAYGGQGLNQSCSHRPKPEPQQYQIQGVSATYTTANGNAGSLTH